MKNKRGLTLVEVVVALAVFSITVVMAYPILTVALRSNIHTENKLVAQEIGSFVAETLNYSASRYEDKGELKTALLSPSEGLCIDDLCEHGFVVGNFECELDSGPTCNRIITQNIFNYNNTQIKDFSIVIDFNAFNDVDLNQNAVKVEVHKNDAIYETFEWLRYK